MTLINTDKFSASLRSRMIDLDSNKVLISRISGSVQEDDLSESVNCGGVGRIHHFLRDESDTGWPNNPLPIDPANRHLKLASKERINAQVFQNAGCNWRCWYCYVPFPLLSADESKGKWMTAAELIDCWRSSADPAPVLDLSGGQPDLTPEWAPWIVAEISRRKLDSDTFIWSDDNLSNYYFWDFLSDDQVELLTNSVAYSRVGCFKGFDAESFQFNTNAYPELFDRQFKVFSRLLGTGIPMYAYVTLTNIDTTDIRDRVRDFVDRLQQISGYLPLRTIPLEIKHFSPMVDRIPDDAISSALYGQQAAVEVWQQELETRFTSAERAVNIVDVQL